MPFTYNCHCENSFTAETAVGMPPDWAWEFLPGGAQRLICKDCDDLRRRGGASPVPLKKPKAAGVESEKKGASSIVDLFLAEHFVITETASTDDKISTTEVYRLFYDWTKKTGKYCISCREFQIKMTLKGAILIHCNGTYWVNLSRIYRISVGSPLLKPQAAEQAAPIAEAIATKTSFFQMASGAMIDLACPDYSKVTIRDIATGLSNECRFGGQIARHYSVASHSIIGAEIARVGSKYAFLMHDGPEAVIKDITSPLKSCLPDYRAIEARHTTAFNRRFHVPLFANDRTGAFEEEHEYIKEIDSIMLLAEMVVMRGYDDGAARAQLPFDGGIDKYEKAKVAIAEHNQMSIGKIAEKFIATWILLAPPVAQNAELALLNIENAGDLLRNHLLAA